jgi:chromate transporter
VTPGETPARSEASAERTKRLGELARLFLRLGIVGFGGPAAHIALMEREVVRRFQWLTREEFLDLLGATNLIPGPNSTELAIQIGHRRAGWPGLLVAGACFILPAAAIVLAIAWFYVRYQSLPEVGALLYGVKPVIIAIVIQAIVGLARSAVKSPFLGLLGIGALAASILGLDELTLLLAAGALAALAAQIRAPRARPPAALALLPGLPLAGAIATNTVPFTLGALFLGFLKIGSVLFGSGYVLLAFLRADFVERLGWLSEQQLLDAVAVGQVTPGPVFTTATFIGYILGGVAGAALATLGIFLPAFVFVAVSGPLVPRLRRSKWAGAFLDGVNVASLALMVAVTWYFGRAAVIDAPTVLLALGSAVALIRYRVGSVGLVLAGGLVGSLVFAIGAKG